MVSMRGSKLKGKNGRTQGEVEEFAGTNLAPSQDVGGEWQIIIPKRNKNKPGKALASSPPHPNPPRVLGDQQQRMVESTVSGRGNANTWGSQAMKPAVTKEEVPDVDDVSEEEESSDDYYEDSASDDYYYDDDSDASQQSHETRKNSKWFKSFFQSLDCTSIETIDAQQRQWHCPACQGGPGATFWYKLQPLLAHARSKGDRRVKLHRELAEVLDMELKMRGASVIPCGEIYGKWKGLGEEGKDREVVWPPMVIIMNTKLDKDDNDNKWIGMGNPELLEYFNEYPASKACHSYGPEGHRGMSVLIFESSATGYFEAECLHKDLAEKGLDRNAWHRQCNLFSGGVRQLYGFLATKQDMDEFNEHCQGKKRLKYEMKSYQEDVVKKLRQNAEDIQQLNWFKSKLAKQNKHAKALEESLGILSEKLRKTAEENRLVRLRTKMQHEQNREEMDAQERFFSESIKQMHDNRDAKEEGFEILQHQKNANLSSKDGLRKRAEEVSSFTELQEKEMGEREKLIEEHEKKMIEMQKRHTEEMLDLERDFDKSLEEFMNKHCLHDAK